MPSIAHKQLDAKPNRAAGSRRSSRSVLLDTLQLKPEQPITLHQQLYAGIRALIKTGHLTPGSLLPSTRLLARDLSVSRNTVIAAFDRLGAEGYIENRPRSGTFVAQAFTTPERDRQSGTKPATRQPSCRGQYLLSLKPGPDIPAPMLFTPGVPATDHFPHVAWRRAAGRAWRSAGDPFLHASHPFGLPELRRAIADHTLQSRGVACQPEQVLVVSSSREAIYLAGLVLADPNDTAWIEEPGYLGAQAALQATGLRLAPIPVDGHGLPPERARQQAPNAKLAYLTPSNQYPLGGTLSSARRRALLDWAANTNGWILEDDYDGEFCYGAQPLQALQGMDGDGRVLYIGTFSKTLYLGLRLAYIVVPPDLVNAFETARVIVAAHAATDAQAILAEFINTGQFQAHIRRMRQIYARRRDALLAALERQLGDELAPRVSSAGLHLAVTLRRPVDDRAIGQTLSGQGIGALPLSRFYLSDAFSQPGLVLGFAAAAEDRIESGVARIAQAVRDAPSSTS